MRDNCTREHYLFGHLVTFFVYIHLHINCVYTQLKQLVPKLHSVCLIQKAHQCLLDLSRESEIQKLQGDFRLDIILNIKTLEKQRTRKVSVVS